MVDLHPGQEQQIRDLASSGRLIQAVKLYRELTNAGLTEAKEAVEAIMEAAPLKVSPYIKRDEPDAFLENQIERLLAEGKKIQAVKLVRETYNCGLKEAKDVVDSIQIGMREEGHSRLLHTQAIGDDPFVNKPGRNLNLVLFFVAILLVALGGVLFFLLQGGF